ncbi:hypothetical protein AAC387_Pa04g0875 [Persea americana]
MSRTEDPNANWTTWEELLLSFAVNQHSTKSWAVDDKTNGVDDESDNCDDKIQTRRAICLEVGFKPNPVHIQQHPERCYELTVRHPLMVVGTADRNLVVFDLQNPQFSVWCLHQLQLDQAFQKVYKIFSSVQDGWISTLSWDSAGIVLNRLGDGVFLHLLPLSMAVFNLVGSQENTITPNLIFRFLHCSNERPSAGYSPTAPGYSPSSTVQYTPQLSNRDKDEDKNG